LRGITAEKRFLLPVGHLGGNGDFQEKDIEIIDAFSECRKNYRQHRMLLSFEIEAILHERHMFEGVVENIRVIASQGAFLGIEIMVVKIG
jgi:hypothetical protein